MILTISVVAFMSATTLRAEDPALEYETVIPGYYLSSGRGIVADDSGNAYGIANYYEDHQDAFHSIFEYIEVF